MQAVKQEIERDIKDILKGFHDMGNEAEDCITLLQTAFIYNTQGQLKDCIEKTEAMKKKEDDLTGAVTGIAAINPEVKPYVSVSTHLTKILGNIEKLSKLVDKKIMENLLFSDKAVYETIFLLQRLNEILGPTADMILAKNKFLSMYIRESQKSIEHMAAEYATLHENQLIGGECLPTASALYVSMLESIKSIAWHTKEIAVELAG
jgi:Na+/phosphate symporter